MRLGVEVEALDLICDISFHVSGSIRPEFLVLLSWRKGGSGWEGIARCVDESAAESCGEGRGRREREGREGSGDEGE